MNLPRINISPLHQNLPLRRILERHTAVLAQIVASVLVLGHAVNEIAAAGRDEREAFVGVAEDEVDVPFLCHVAVLRCAEGLPDEDVVQDPGVVEVLGDAVFGFASGGASVGGDGDDVCEGQCE